MIINQPKKIIALGGSILATLSAQVLAEQTLAEAPAKMSAAGGPNTSQIINLFLSLVLIIALIFVCAWLFKRASAIGNVTSKQLRVLGGLSLSAKEKVVLVKAGGKQILIGVAPGRVNALHVFDEAIIDEDAESNGASEFARQLASIGKGRKA